jgi:alpha/beta superfamily hydrolase
MVGKEFLSIRNNEIELEAEYFQSKKDKNSPVVLICHPHPQYGGNMFNNVVSGVYAKLIKHEVSCLRFNFRGVGRSTGIYSNGMGELSDVKACIDFLIMDKNFERLVICGYSYGAAIGCSAINHSDKIIGYIAISFPLTKILLPLMKDLKRIIIFIMIQREKKLLKEQIIFIGGMRTK